METKENVAQEGEFKMKKKKGRPKKLYAKEDGTIKVDLSKKEETKKTEEVIPEVKAEETAPEEVGAHSADR